MNKIYSRLFLLLALTLIKTTSFAQIVSTSLFLQGRYLEIGAMPNGSLGSGVTAPAGYHPRPGGTIFGCSMSISNSLASVYDYGKDGWTVGTPAYMGDYTLPGSPWEGWAIQVDGTCGFAYQSGCAGFTVTPATAGWMTGSWTGYTNSGGIAKGVWQGTAGGLNVTQEYRVDTLSSALVVTVKMVNPTATPKTGVYYMRTCDPDNNQTWPSGSFTTINRIEYQNDYRHRVMVSATSSNGSVEANPPTPLGLGTRDCRAKAVIYTSWPLSTSATLASIYSETSGSIGTSYYAVNSSYTGDVAIGLVYNIGTIPANDSAVISYAYAYDDSLSNIDEAFPDPQINVNGVLYDSFVSLSPCSGGSASGIIPVNIIHGDDKQFTWSTWTWAPSTGLASTVGLNNSINTALIPSSGISYTVTANTSEMGSCANKTFIIQIIMTTPPPPFASSVTYCQEDIAIPLTAVGAGTFTWFWPGGPSAGSTVAPTPSTAIPGVTTYSVIQTLAGCISDTTTLSVTIKPKPSAPIAFDTAYCQFTPAAPLHALGTSLRWYTVASGSIGISTPPIPSTNVPGVGTWYVSQIYDGCESDRTPVNVTTVYVPVFQIAASQPFACQTDSILLSYDGPALISPSYTWTLPNGASFVGDTNSLSSSMFVRFDSLYNQYVTLTAYNYNGMCWSTDSIKIKVVPQPSVTATFPETICQNDTVLIGLAEVSSNAFSYLWDFAGGSIVSANSNSSGPYRVKFTDSGSKFVNVIALTEEGCRSEYYNDTIRVHAAPSSVIDVLSAGACLEDSTHIKAHLISAANSYVWTPAAFFTDNTNPDAYVHVTAAGYVKLWVQNAYGCVSMDSVYFNPDACCTVSFPNAFVAGRGGNTPNSVFRPIFNGFHRFHTFRIFNRWGQVVFEGTNNNMAWDGTFGGVPQDMGTYFYVLTYDCGASSVGGDKGNKEYTQSGEVILVR